jgi:hypothetical protein
MASPDAIEWLATCKDVKTTASLSAGEVVDLSTLGPGIFKKGRSSLSNLILLKDSIETEIPLI